MTWPFENDTSAITKKLAKRNLKADKSRNILIIITIALATCLIMTTTLYFFASQRKSLNDAAGRYQAIINEVDNDTITKLVNDSRVQVGVSHLLGLVSYGDYKLTVRSMDETLMKLAKYPDLEGELPKSTNEIAITKAFLDRAGLSKSIGDTISLNLGDGEKDYTLCGILPVENSNYSVFVSQSYIDNKLSEPAYSAYIRLNESDGWSKAAIQAELSTLCRELEIQPEQMQFSTYYFSLIEQRSSQYITVIAFISLIIALACTLVIYSLFYVSIARKTKEYGKLRTIGATGKQIKRIVIRERYNHSRIAIPIGILAGAIAGYVLVPQGWNTLMVFVIAAVTALFVYLCVMIAVIKPAKIAAHVTPIEAVRYMASNNDVMSNSTKVLHRSLSAKNLAFLNFARNRKKTALTILSLGVCGILLMASSAYFNSIDPLAMARRSFPYGEIRLELGDYGPQAHNSEQYSELQKSNLLTEDFRESILDIDGVEEIKEYQGTVLNVRMPTGDIEPIVSDAYTRSSQKLIEQYLIDGTADLQELLKNNGIIIENGPQWKETFGWDAAIGDELLIEVGGQTLEVKVMGIVDANIPYGGYDTLFIPLEMLSKIVPIDNLNYQFIVDTDDSKWAAAKDEIQKIIPPTSSLYVSTLNDWVEAYNEKLLNYRMPVYIFVMFIGVFGIINLLNTLITNILTRKRELGVLQAVGLSSKQLSKMLLIEGLFYTLGVLLLSISCGTLIGYLLCTVFSAMSIFGKSYGTKISGQVFMNGKEVKLNTVQEAIDNKLAYVTEDRKGNGLILSKSIKMNTSLANMKGVSNGKVIDADKEYAVAEDYRKKLKTKCPSVEQNVGNLSGGNQQKVLLAKWMFTEPDILILDEPTRGIDVGAKYEIYCIINDLVAAGKSVIMISSELPEVLGMSDRIYIMNEGKFVGEVGKEEATSELIMSKIVKSGKGA